MKRYQNKAHKQQTTLDSDRVSEEQVVSDGHGTVVSDVPSVATLEEGAEERLPERVRLPMRLPSRAQLRVWAPFWGVILLGAVLRFWNLGDRPLHHDESLHAYYSLHLMWDMQRWSDCFKAMNCYHYDPLLHGPFQFHAIAFVYKVCQLLGVYDNGVNTTTVRIAAATLGTVIVGLPYFLRDYLGKIGAWLACFLLAVSPSMVYFARFAREDTYMACFTLLLVVGAARYMRDRQMRWLVLAAAGLSLAYATKEATFLLMAIVGSYFGALLAWECGLKWQVQVGQGKLARLIAKNGSVVALCCYFMVLGPLAKVLLGWMKDLSIYITDPQNTSVANEFVKGLKMQTVALLPLFGVIVVICVLFSLTRQSAGSRKEDGLMAEAEGPDQEGNARGKARTSGVAMGERRGLGAGGHPCGTARVDPARQPLLDALVTMPWTHWFFALLAGWTIFMLLFTVLFTNFVNGLGDGIWQGLYYWLQQQQVARGGQPWYYYFLLIPLYEQVGLVFGLVGVVRCITQPSRFRLFLVYWFVGSLFIYSWAGEKMPWLVIHIMMPLLLLAANALEPAVMGVIDLLKGWMLTKRDSLAGENSQVTRKGKRGKLSRGGVPNGGMRSKHGVALATCLLAGLLLILTLQNMLQVTYVHAADGPHEMMIYVQSAPDVHLVMSKVDALDQQLYGGKHQLSIGLMDEATWPFVWYLRDYTNVCLSFPTGCGDKAKDVQVIITAGNQLEKARMQYATSNSPGRAPDFLFHQYIMRNWWDEGYKPPPCVATATQSCGDSPTWGGVGAGLWLSYGDTPPPGAQFNLGLAAQRIWQWWWQRTPFGGTGGAFNMGFFIRKDLGVAP
ncbi:MAG TPA: flippase activity-associated protein Agl23 [Ktedonosporobacter sp.]|nr:flippase activity-associated protein Agl23 [Ktedonosporobacter sp.]